MWSKFDNAEEKFIEWNGIEPEDDEDEGDDSYSGLLSYPPGQPCSHSRHPRNVKNKFQSLQNRSLM